METIGYATLQIIPSMRDTGRNLNSGFAPFVSAGRQAGQDAGQAAAAGIASSRSAVEKASATLAKARDQEADAAGKIRVAEMKLEELRNSSRSTASQIAAAEERLETARRGGVRTADAATAAADGLAEAERRAATATDESAASTENMGKKSVITTENLVKLGVLGATAVAGLATALFSVGSVFDDVSDTIRIGTGATGDALSALEQSAKNVGSTVPSSLESIGTTIADVNTRLGLTGPTLETFTSQILQAGNMLGEEIDINGLTASFTAFGVGGDQTVGVMDELFRVSQATGVGMNELAASAVKGAPQLQQFGFSLAESAGLVGSLDKAGLDADKTLGAMNKALVQFAKDGKEPQEALFGVVTEMQNLVDAGNDGAAIDLASGLFGTKGAGQFVQAVKMGTLSVDDFVSATGASSDTILGAASDTADFAEQWQLFKNNVLILIEPIASKVFGAISQGMGYIVDTGVPALQRFGEVVTGAFSEGGALSGVSKFGETLVSMGESAFPVLVGAAQNLGDVLSGIGTGVAAVTQFFKDHEVVLGIVSTVIGVGLVPSLVGLTATFATTAAGAVTSGITMTGVWISTQASAVVSAGAQVLAQYRIVAGWVATAAGAVTSGAIVVGQYVAAGASATLQAGIAAGAWVLSSARTVGALALQGAAFVAQKAVMIAGAAATGIATAAQWAFNLALSANPITLVIIGITALVGGLIWFFTQTEIGQKIVTAAWDGIRAGWDWLYEKVSGGITALGDFLGYLGEKAGEAKDWVVGKFNDLVGFVTALPGRVSSSLSSMWNGMQDGFKAALNWIIGKWNNFSLGFKLPDILGGKKISIDTPDIPYFRDGGPVSGPGGPRTDSILARLSDGEYVEPAAAVTPRTLPVLEAIRNGWVPSPDFLRALVGYADGGMVTADDMNRFPRENGLEGAEYDWGGVQWGDCSGAMSALANYATGRDPFGSRFATGNEGSELSARGFQQGMGPAGSLSIGWYNDPGGPGGGHTAGTLPDGTHVEMGGSRGDGQVGGMAAGADDPMFTDVMHLPPDFFLGGNPDASGGDAGGASSLAGSLGGTSGGGASGGGGATGIGGSFSGGNAGEVKIAAGDAQPVWVTNWPSSAGGGSFSSEPVEAMADSGDVANYTPVSEVAPPETPLGGAGVDAQYQAPTAEDVGAIGTDFVKANTDQLLSDLGLPSSPGGLLGGLMEAIKTIGPVIEEHVHYHVDSAKDAVREHTGHQRERALAYSTGKR